MNMTYVQLVWKPHEYRNFSLFSPFTFSLPVSLDVSVGCENGGGVPANKFTSPKMATPPTGFLGCGGPISSLYSTSGSAAGLGKHILLPW